ncbi:hypothetical protein DXA13_17585 [Clostridium sp. AM58-1XD]|nr:hypothetical protein DXA13_17585 [Clostridium sp. AM58-1XD]
MSARRTLYLRILVSAQAAESQALGSAGGTIYTERIWYNVRKTDIIPAHTGFCVSRRKPGAGIRRRSVAKKKQNGFKAHGKRGTGFPIAEQADRKAAVLIRERSADDRRSSCVCKKGP